MKQRWEVKKLGEVCLISTGKSNTEDAVENGNYAFFDRSKIIKKSSKYLFDCDAIIVAGEGQTFLPKFYSGKFDLHQRAYAIFNFDKDVSVHYVYKYLIHFHKYFAEVAVGATAKSLRLRHFQDLPIPIPSLHEQQRIVEILDEVFDGIVKAKANAEQNLKNAQELFESYFQGIFENKSDKWKQDTLGAILSEPPKNGWSPPAKYHSNTGTPVLTLSAVTGFIFKSNSIKYTSAHVKNEATYWIKNGDLLITRSNTPELVGHVAICQDLSEMTIYPDLMMKINPNESIVLTKFLYYQLKSPKLREIIMNSSHGANPTMKKINKQDVQSFEITYPSLPDQQTIVQKLDALSLETKKLETIYRTKIADLEELKKSILHKAFNGEL
jgi:type I restriction enzyme S subunit